MHVIAVTNQKGGVGKTTTSVNVAVFLAEMGERVLLIDLDPQANATSGLGIRKRQGEHSMYHVLFDPSLAETAIITTEHDGLLVLPSTPELAGAEVELVTELGREYRLKQLITRFDVDYIIIDCPPSLGLLTINALTASTHVLIPVQAEYYALEGVSHLLETITRVKQALNPELDILGVLMTMYDNRTALSGQVEAEVKKYFKDKVIKTAVPRNVRLAEAPSHGKPIKTYNKRSKGSKAYKKVTQEIHRRTKGGSNVK
jgi:chromosome partitioning protein